MTDRGEDSGYVGLPYEHPQNAAIGRVVIAWALFERMIDQFIWRLAGVEPSVGACFTAQFISPRPRLHTAIALCRLRGVSEPMISELNKFKSRTDGIYQKRNRIVHDPWLVGNLTQTVVRSEITAQSRLSFEYKPVPEPETSEILTAIDKHSEQFQNLYFQICEELQLDRP